MQTIKTKFISSTNTKCARIKATTTGGISKTIAFPYELDSEAAHYQAARALIVEKMPDWTGDYIQGHMADGYVFVMASDTKRSL